MLILLGNDIPENPGPFDNEISIFHLNIRSIRHKLDYVEANIFTKFLENKFITNNRRHLNYVE
jgi:hypothetical protein